MNGVQCLTSNEGLSLVCAFIVYIIYINIVIYNRYIVKYIYIYIYLTTYLLYIYIFLHRGWINPTQEYSRKNCNHLPACMYIQLAWRNNQLRQDIGVVHFSGEAGS